MGRFNERRVLYKELQMIQELVQEHNETMFMEERQRGWLREVHGSDFTEDEEDIPPPKVMWSDLSSNVISEAVKLVSIDDWDYWPFDNYDL